MIRIWFSICFSLYHFVKPNITNINNILIAHKAPNWSKAIVNHPAPRIIPQASICTKRQPLSPSRQVSWIRRQDFQLLTVGLSTYSSDERFQVEHTRHMGHWSLRIKAVREDDRGLYECQLSVHPTQSIFVELQVIGKCLAGECVSADAPRMDYAILIATYFGPCPLSPLGSSVPFAPPPHLPAKQRPLPKLSARPICTSTRAPRSGWSVHCAVPPRTPTSFFGNYYAYYVLQSHACARSLARAHSKRALEDGHATHLIYN